MKDSKEEATRIAELGTGKYLAQLTSCCGDRYCWVGARICMKSAISKKVLNRVEFVSCPDYYNERHALKLR